VKLFKKEDIKPTHFAQNFIFFRRLWNFFIGNKSRKKSFFFEKQFSLKE
jgi:hypothetical protein